MHSIHRKTIEGLGRVKLYEHGVVGIDQFNTPRKEYITEMRPLKKISPASNQLLYQAFKVK